MPDEPIVYFEYLSIRWLLEELEKKEALEKYGAEDSGKNLPFSSLSKDLDKKGNK